MLKTIVLLISLIPLINGDCGYCEVDPAMSTNDKNQALSFNAMPNNWKTVPVADNIKAFVDASHMRYGPQACKSDCSVDWKYGGFTTCDYITKKHEVIRGPDRHLINWATGFCSVKYRDDANRPCLEPSQWDPDWKMWCRTHYSGSVYNWGNTHFPICSTTGNMCVPP